MVGEWEEKGGNVGASCRWAEPGLLFCSQDFERVHVQNRLMLPSKVAHYKCEDGNARIDFDQEGWTAVINTFWSRLEMPKIGTVFHEHIAFFAWYWNIVNSIVILSVARERHSFLGRDLFVFVYKSFIALQESAWSEEDHPGWNDSYAHRNQIVCALGGCPIGQGQGQTDRTLRRLFSHVVGKIC